ncbi:monooxygenase family protein [Sphingomonas sp. CJ20]
MQSVQRSTVDLSAYPDLCVIVLGIRLRGLRGLRTLFGIGPGLSAVRGKNWPDGLLADEPLIFGWGHFGMRQYWRDLESLQAFTRSAPHAQWWSNFLKRYNGAGFWHETYCRSGAMEAVYVDVGKAMGFGRFAPQAPATGAFKTMDGRLAATRPVAG